MVHFKKKYYICGRSTLTKWCLLWLREVHNACIKVWELTQTSLKVSTKLSGVTNVWPGGIDESSSLQVLMTENGNFPF